MAVRFVKTFKEQTIKPPKFPLKKKGGCKSTELIGNLQGFGG